jgi:hypothetical protein
MKIPLTTVTLVLVASTVAADPLTCNLADYKAAPGLTAGIADEALVVTWDGENGAELRMRLGIEGGTPTIRELAIRRRGGSKTGVEWSGARLPPTSRRNSASSPACGV